MNQALLRRQQLPGSSQHAQRPQLVAQLSTDVHSCFRHSTRPPRRAARGAAAGKQDDPSSASDDERKQKFFRSASPDGSSSNSSGNAFDPTGSTSEDGASLAGLDLDKVNPYALGKQARQRLNEVWSQFTRLTAPTKSYIFDDVLDARLDSEPTLQAEATTVLVVGATGRVGRILTRKLLLRGYTVKALVRKRDELRSAASLEGLPSAVDFIEGDVGELADCQRAIRGVQKIIFCASARSRFTADLLRVDEQGVKNLAKAMQDEFYRQDTAGRAAAAQRVAAATAVGGSAADSQPTSGATAGSKPAKAAAAGVAARHHSSRGKLEIADFNRRYHQTRWDVEFCGLTKAQRETSGAMEVQNIATAEIDEENNLLFEGTLFQRGAIADVGADIAALLPGGDHRTRGTEGLTMRVRGDGHVYTCILTTAQGNAYYSRFATRLGYLNVRLPYNSFRSEKLGQPPLDPQHIAHLTLRYEHRRPSIAAAQYARADDVARDQKFKLQVDWIKALPGGVEPDFILVSCAGTAKDGQPDKALSKLISHKRAGEDFLKMSGLGYTIIRPGTLVEEPGGYRALVFDQGSRITENISYADVADICLRALHEPEARNKTFDVSYEYQPEQGLQLYELVATIPGNASNYLRPALAGLEKNT